MKVSSWLQQKNKKTPPLIVQTIYYIQYMWLNLQPKESNEIQLWCCILSNLFSEVDEYVILFDFNIVRAGQRLNTKRGFYQRWHTSDISIASSRSSAVSLQEEPQRWQSSSSLQLQQSSPCWSFSLDALMYLNEGKQRLTALSHESRSRTSNS